MSSAPTSSPGKAREAITRPKTSSANHPRKRSVRLSRSAMELSERRSRNCASSDRPRSAARCLKRLDPAEKLLDLKICDPAIGSGHFLVSLVDYLADQVIAAMAEAEARGVGPITSPLQRPDRCDPQHHSWQCGRSWWTIDPDPARRSPHHPAHGPETLHLWRRQEPYGGRTGKGFLWLHTFTVGAPLSFLDHHLRCGDSLFGRGSNAALRRRRASGAPSSMGL